MRGMGRGMGGIEGKRCGDRSGLSLLSLSRDMVCVTYCM